MTWRLRFRRSPQLGRMLTPQGETSMGMMGCCRSCGRTRRSGDVCVRYSWEVRAMQSRAECPGGHRQGRGSQSELYCSGWWALLAAAKYAAAEARLGLNWRVICVLLPGSKYQGAQCGAAMSEVAHGGASCVPLHFSNMMCVIHTKRHVPCQASMYRDLRPQRISLPDPTNMFLWRNVLCCCSNGV